MPEPTLYALDWHRTRHPSEEPSQRVVPRARSTRATGLSIPRLGQGMRQRPLLVLSHEHVSFSVTMLVAATMYNPVVTSISQLLCEF